CYRSLITQGCFWLFESFLIFFFFPPSLLKVHLSFLLFLHRLAEEARTNAFENKSKIIKPEHTIAAAKVIKHF
uniref:Centromere protein W n=2 Tax=Neoaves TaxID=3078114 RepID=A0A8C0EBY5_BUBBB